jgi:DNA replication initiation complex subunit (GINS family)
MPREEEDESLKPVLIRVLEDLPEFAGPSRDYSLLKEDVVTIPKAMADILVNTGKASLIDPSP